MNPKLNDVIPYGVIRVITALLRFDLVGQGRAARQMAVDWQFATADARVKLKHLWPKVME